MQARGGGEMSETPDPEAQEDSILGSLPRSRPGVRSPRRDAARARAKRGVRADAPRARADAGAEPAADANLEELARAGVTTAAQIAAAGLRFAGRAAGAIRESLERR